MGQYRKKPVVIEAEQYLLGEVIRAKWLFDAMESGIVFSDADGLKIKTLEGVMSASVGDWIIKGVKGEIYACKPDIFAATYEAA
jgi:hypothetical protein